MTFTPDPNEWTTPLRTTVSAEQMERDRCVDELNSLLRGEISAAETYTMAINKMADEKSHVTDVDTLREIQRDHGGTAQRIRQRIVDLGGQPSDGSGAWGAWAKTVEGAATLFGDRAALKALKEGEEHGLKEYIDCRDEIDATTAEMVAAEFIPAQERHIGILDQLMNSPGRA